MPRNSSGSCSVDQPPFNPNTPITSAAANANNNDFADMLTDSLSRSGKGGMQTTLSLSITGFNYSSDTNTGMSRPAADTQVIRVGGDDYTITTDDITAPDGTSILPLIGEIRMYFLTTAPDGWIFMRGQACTTSYPRQRAALIAAGSPFGTSGSDPLFPDMQCVIAAGFDATGRGLLTGSTVFASSFGAQSQTIAQANLPDVTLSTTIAAGQGSHNHEIAIGAVGTTTGPGAALFGIGGPSSTNTNTLPEMSGTTPLGGSGTALSIVQPTIILNFIARAA